jgi:hypothetical protein
VVGGTGGEVECRWFVMWLVSRAGKDVEVICMFLVLESAVCALLALTRAVEFVFAFGQASSVLSGSG